MNKGFPRPKIELYGKQFPLPYSAREDAISLLSDERHLECVRDCVCLVCGDPVEDENSFALLKDEKFHAEAGPFHDKCARLTVAMCPHIKNDKKWTLKEFPTADILTKIKKFASWVKWEQ